MTREIKFRGKAKLDGKWWFGNLVPKDTRGRTQINDPEHGGCFDIDPETVSQFTGLHDKNGKEIYDGDIIAVNGIQIGYIVGGVRGYCYDVIYTPAKNNGEKSWPLYSVVTRDYPNKCEVIGNIHDNPELLKQK